MPDFVICSHYGRPSYEIDWREPSPSRRSEGLSREVHRVQISEALAAGGIDKVLEAARATPSWGPRHGR